MDKKLLREEILGKLDRHEKALILKKENELKAEQEAAAARELA